MRADSQDESKVHAQSSHVGTSLTRNPTDTKVSLFIKLNELDFIDSPDSEFLLDSGDFWRLLEASASKHGKGSCNLLFSSIDLSVKLENGHVLFSSTLLSLYQSGSIANACDEAASDLRVESAGVASLFDLKDLLNPRDNFVG